MDKRNYKQIELDVKAIQEAAKHATSLKEVSEITGLTYKKVSTSLSRHPIIRKRVLAALEANKKGSVPVTQERTISIVEKIPSHSEDEEGKWVVICDCPALVYGLRSCTETPIVIPQFVEDSIIGISRYSSIEGGKANAVLTRMGAFYDWCTVAPRLDNESLLVEPESEPSWRAKALVALACKYVSEGYTVTVKTRTAEIYQLALLQGCLTVNFVPADSEVKLKVIS